MYTAGDLVLSGVGITLMTATVTLWGGLRSSLRWGRNAFFSLGLFMIFQGWLQFINFDGGWPADQPPDKEVYRWQTKANEQRIWNAIGPDLATMTARDWDDYHRCGKLNVCVRKFQGLRTEAGKPAPTSMGNKSNSIPQPNFETWTSTPTTETRCVLMDGVLKCNEYIRR